jgi:hypothetical protein
MYDRQGNTVVNIIEEVFIFTDLAYSRGHADINR